MNRDIYFNYISEKLNILINNVSVKSKLNLLDLNIHVETFFAELLNLIFKYKLKNINALQHNTEAIDLIDETNKIVAQVSSVKTKKKIENSLNKPLLKNYTDFKFIFIVVASDAKNLKNKTYKNPYNLSFDPKTDIYDIKTLLEIILHKDIEILENVYKFIMKELDRKDINTTKIDSNLASIINILALENLQDIEVNPQTHSFEIQKKLILMD